MVREKKKQTRKKLVFIENPLKKIEKVTRRIKLKEEKRRRYLRFSSKEHIIKSGQK